MTNAEKWTVRNVTPEALEMLQEVSQNSGAPMGELLSDAVADWYQRLPETTEEDDDRVDQAQPVITPRSPQEILRMWLDQAGSHKP